MLPRRSSSNSQRRSSILKPAKSRQPFQDLDFNISSPEISPESTKKRRVSFAEKKHVKEFCDHKEQGTIWDSTYEEADHNVSRSTEASNDNAIRINTKNVEIVGDEAGSDIPEDVQEQDLTNPERFLIMERNGIGNSSTILFNSEADLDLTDVIPDSQITPNYLISQTTICQDGDLDETEPMGGIEPTISINKILDSRKRKSLTKDSLSIAKEIVNTEKTMVFDDSGGEMMFTEIISGGKNQTLILPNIDTSQELGKTDSFIENQTIIFEDSIMDLTLTKSQEVLGLDSSRNVENILSQAVGIGTQSKKNDLCNIGEQNYHEPPQNSNKTILFDDFGCEMTEAVNTNIRRVPQINVENKENIPVNHLTVKNTSIDICAETAAIETNNLSIEENVTTDLVTHANKTIFFNDIGCEMTEAIHTFKSHPAVIENVVEKENSERIVPQELLRTNLIPKSVEMAMEACEGRNITSSNNTGAEPMPSLISQHKDRTEYFNDSVMDFTVAISKEKNKENVEVEENCFSRRSETIIFDNCNVDITEAVKTLPCILNSGSNSKERHKDLSNTEIDSTELQSNRKRQSYETETNVDHSRTANPPMNKSDEHDLVQTMVHNESTYCMRNENLLDSLTPNCKHSRPSDMNAKENSNSGSENDLLSVEMEVMERNSNRTIGLSPPLNTQEIPPMQIQVSEGAETPNDSVNNLAEQDLRIGENAVSNYCDDQERLMVVDKKLKERNGSRKLDEDEVSKGESSTESVLGRLNSDSDSESESLYLSHVYTRQNVSTVEKSIKVEGHTETNENLDYNDDCCFVMFSEELEKHAKREDCIWTIRSLNTEKVVINFISKSLVVVICLEATEELTTPRMIKDIKIVSLLQDSADEDISMIHKILLKKLDPENLKLFHKTTLDVLPMLEIISKKVKLLLDFMYEFDKLQDLHLINKSGNCISFLLHSYKVQLVIKVTIDLERFEEIGPNDVQVQSILGNIRERDIKQLITSVKKDHRFLSKYIDDIKEYIALVVEK